MHKINESNYPVVLQNLLGSLSLVAKSLGRDRKNNQTEIINLNNAISTVQNMIQAERQKTLRTRTENYYSRKIADAYSRRTTLKSQMRDIVKNASEEI